MRPWACPICGSPDGEVRFVLGTGTGAPEDGVDPDAFRPSTIRFGRPAGAVFGCRSCGHGSTVDLPDPEAVLEAYTSAVDPVSLREERGQVETARRALGRIERWLAPGRLCDLGCWTGSFLAAGAQRGWSVTGVEPSRWASDRARDRGLEVHTRPLEAHGLDPGSWRLVVLTDVLEHLADPAHAVAVAADLLEPGGGIYVTVPDAGSWLARALGRRWWSVVPMHLQYFTRASMGHLLTGQGLRVVHLGSHAKAFTVRYYAERLGGYSPTVGRLASAAAARAAQAERLVAPDLRDRMEVLAIRP